MMQALTLEQALAACRRNSEASAEMQRLTAPICRTNPSNSKVMSGIGRTPWRNPIIAKSVILRGRLASRTIRVNNRMHAPSI
jgi:hypothetical protein